MNEKQFHFSLNTYHTLKKGILKFIFDKPLLPFSQIKSYGNKILCRKNNGIKIKSFTFEQVRGGPTNHCTSDLSASFQSGPRVEQQQKQKDSNANVQSSILRVNGSSSSPPSLIAACAYKHHHRHQARQARIHSLKNDGKCRKN